ncbi:MAG: quinone-dependent dihydroorotate dehydrogenase [Saprospiraceae bacterium]|nr:quinone-dependent dihydroorotate dehydrogenase [Pyrinomonadaceae bacterium]
MYDKFIRPALFAMDAERVHEIGVESLRLGLSSKAAQKAAATRFETTVFSLERFGLTFKNPLGIAAGFDKNGVVVNQLAALGFGFVEIGTVTFEPQKGNEKPRLFRLPEDKALINRLGFNNDGAAKVVERLKKMDPQCVLGVNIGKNKDVPIEEATENYIKSFDLAIEVADYIAVNISSPNTPNLREMQKAQNLEELLGALQTSNAIAKKPLLVKIAPDLADEEIETIVDMCRQFGIDGIIATNTTIKREDLKTGNAALDKIGAGGLSGKPLRQMSDHVISKIHKYSKGKLPIIGVGGIFTAHDAFEKIAAGACLLQAYTGFIYSGPSFARDVNTGLAAIVRQKGFKNLDEAIGSDSL